jgi:DNA-binding MarR family transcriptional regulator
MKPSRKSPATPERASANPWADVDADGTALDVFNFPTTLMTLVGNVLRRTITADYTQALGLTVAEWRLLSVLAHADSLSFLELETLSSTDKSLVSRTLRLLESRDLVSIQDRGNAGRKKLTAAITPAGRQLNRRVMLVARRKQAELLRLLPPDDRAAVFRALQIWHEHYAGCPAPTL